MLNKSGLLSIFLISACVAPGRVERIAINDKAILDKSCESPSSKTCAFINSPVPLKSSPVKIFSRKNTFYPTAQPLEFIDSQGRR